MTRSEAIAAHRKKLATPRRSASRAVAFEAIVSASKALEAAAERLSEVLEALERLAPSDACIAVGSVVTFELDGVRDTGTILGVLNGAVEVETDTERVIAPLSKVDGCTTKGAS